MNSLSVCYAEQEDVQVTTLLVLEVVMSNSDASHVLAPGKLQALSKSSTI
jgi:hypothetical protein